MDTNEVEQINERLVRLEKIVFGMDYENALRIIDSFTEASKENHSLEPSHRFLKAEKMLGI